MLLYNCFHSDDKSHDHVPFPSPGFPYVCIRTDMEKYADRRVPWHWHSSCEIVTVEQGTIELRTQDQILILQKGDAAFVNKGVLHTYQAVSEEAAVQYANLFHADFLSGTYNSIFDEKYFQPILRCTALQAWRVRPDSKMHLAMISAVLEAQTLVSDEPDGYEFDIRTQLCEFWKGLYQETDDLRTNAPVRNLADSERIKQMMDYVQEHYNEPLTVDDIAAAAGISARECSRCFHRCIGVSPIEHLTYFRVRAATAMLAETSKSILEISEDCGFSSSSYFSKVFRETTGLTPKAYQKKSKLSES